MAIKKWVNRAAIELISKLIPSADILVLASSHLCSAPQAIQDDLFIAGLSSLIDLCLFESYRSPLCPNLMLYIHPFQEKFMNRNYSGDFELLAVASRFIGKAIAVAFTQKRAELVFAACSANGLAPVEQVLHSTGTDVLPVATIIESRRV